jgi:thiol:disulfide interchange protein DsbD
MASAGNKRVFIDFTGYTCTNCRKMEKTMFPRPEIKAQMSKFVLARLYTDCDSTVCTEQQDLQQKQFNTVALPYYAVVDGTGKTIATFNGYTPDPVAFLEFLKKAETAPAQTN